jgi:hypothetical protein
MTTSRQTRSVRFGEICSGESGPLAFGLLTFTTFPKAATIGSVLGALVLIAKARIAFKLASIDRSRREYEFL